VGLSCNGFEEQLLAMFTAIITSNAKQGTCSSLKAGKFFFERSEQFVLLYKLWYT
jgi:hypothetical protein